MPRLPRALLLVLCLALPLGACAGLSPWGGYRQGF
jgi:hypothetical protein